MGTGNDGNPVYLKDIWPSAQEIAETVASCLTSEMFSSRYSQVFDGDDFWQNIKVAEGETYNWDDASTYVKNPPYFTNMSITPDASTDIKGAHTLALLGDSITTDHISPAGSIKQGGPAGQYLESHGITPLEFNSYGSRRGNHEVMMRGTFANIRLENEMVPGTTGGITKHIPSGETMSIYDAAMKYKEAGTPLIVVAGKEYGTGSSRDWAAKGTILLGVKVVIAESFERIHRSNLLGMGVLPLEFTEGQSRETLNLTGDETFDILGIEGGITPRMLLTCRITRQGSDSQEIQLKCRIDTEDEANYYAHGGILKYVLRQMLSDGNGAAKVVND